MFNSIKRWFGRPKNPAGNVYYVRLSTPDGIYYKLGYTKKSSLFDRMAYGGHGDEKLIDRELVFSFRDDAWDVEQILLDHFNKHRAFGKYSRDPKRPLCGRGQSELFENDILGLDDDLYAHLEKKEVGFVEGDEEQALEGCLLVLIGIILAPFTLGFSLFFVMGGVSGIWGDGKKSSESTVRDARPKHPPAIQELIDSLKNYNSIA